MGIGKSYKSAHISPPTQPCPRASPSAHPTWFLRTPVQQLVSLSTLVPPSVACLFFCPLRLEVLFLLPLACLVGMSVLLLRCHYRLLARWPSDLRLRTWSHASALTLSSYCPLPSWRKRCRQSQGSLDHNQAVCIVNLYPILIIINACYKDEHDCLCPRSITI